MTGMHEVVCTVFEDVKLVLVQLSNRFSVMSHVPHAGEYVIVLQLDPEQVEPQLDVSSVVIDLHV